MAYSLRNRVTAFLTLLAYANRRPLYQTRGHGSLQMIRSGKLPQRAAIMTFLDRHVKTSYAQITCMVCCRDAPPHTKRLLRAQSLRQI